jgi:hypothetical protein
MAYKFLEFFLQVVGEGLKHISFMRHKILRLMVGLTKNVHVSVAIVSMAIDPHTPSVQSGV